MSQVNFCTDPINFTEKIATLFKGRGRFSRIVISEKGEIKAHSDFIFHFIPLFITRKAAEENQRTVRTLLDVFGARRVQKIGMRYGIDFQRRLNKGLGLNTIDLEKLFTGLADVREDDLKDALSSLKSDEKVPGVLQSLGKDALKNWKENLGNRELEDLSSKQVDDLIKVLVPFKKIEHLFFHKVPKYNRAVRESGKTFRSRREAVYYEESFRRRVREKAISEEDRIYVLAKRVLDREPPEGTIVGYPEGWYKVHKIWHGGGAYAVLFKPLTKTSKLSPMIGFRGTRVTSWAATDNFITGLDDLRKSAGAKGSISAYWGLKKIITDPKEGFIDRKGQLVNVFGMSLGGNHAQSLAATDLVKNIKSVFTVCSLGIYHRVRDVFAERVKDNPHQMNITHMVEEDDVVPDIGHGHLHGPHHKVKVRHITLSVKKAGHERPSFPSGFLSLIRAMYCLFVRCLFRTHTRETVHHHNHKRTELSTHYRDDRDVIERLLDNKSDEKRRLWEEWHNELTFGRDDLFYEFLKEKTGG